MRPSQLSPLFAPIQSLAGIGPRMARLMEKVLSGPHHTGEPRVLDLLWHTPTGVIDRRATPSITDATAGTIVTLNVRVLKHAPPPRGNRRIPYKVRCEDDSGEIDLIFFRAQQKYLEQQLPVGEERTISGRIERYGEALQMAHPDYIIAPDKRDELPMMEPVYPLTAGLTGKVVVKATRQALDRVPDVLEWQEPNWLKSRHWPPFSEALQQVHRPTESDHISSAGPARQRLAFDELLAMQLALGLVRANYKTQQGRSVVGTGLLATQIKDALPFTLTPSQHNAVKDIAGDLAGEARMLRLLQGDVGSGKTIVALLAMVSAVEARSQAALLAPTEVLARQHLETIGPLAEAAGMTVGVLTGKDKTSVRKDILARTASGEIDILIGTHAIFQQDVDFKDLAVAVIDEQHRFGVHQRLALQAKGKSGGVNVLVMTATPIPRTLQMTHYGDLDVSRLTEKPAGRKPIQTLAKPTEQLEDIIDSLRRAVSSGAQVYWVCPLIETSDTSELAAAEERHAHLTQIFGDQVALLHGGMSTAQKSSTMSAFSDGVMKILVATTVIEVGVNVPNATIMVVEHAERFGLAQLHQLRGRVGRGDRQSYCILLYQGPLGDTARQRLQMLHDTDDGFLIAEKDLELRGGGEVLGARQSGMPEFRVAEVPCWTDLLKAARDDAKMVLDKDPLLTSKRGDALKTLLYVFECDEAIRLFRAG